MKDKKWVAWKDPSMAETMGNQKVDLWAKLKAEHSARPMADQKELRLVACLAVSLAD